ncbi:helix-turn-helix transcriptional regulator [Streptomyces sp. NPDC047097]|uniref:helix-turn-helix domain-containing protein n=1 Tax=Streptomyces sp. NPDC047097 TaxID=3155260 RepID=UPI0033C6B792
MSESLESLVAANARSLREAAGWSQEELSRRLGHKSPSSVWQLEQCRRRITLRDVDVLAAVFGVTVGHLLGIETGTPAEARQAVLRYSVRLADSTVVTVAADEFAPDPDDKAVRLFRRGQLVFWGPAAHILGIEVRPEGADGDQ